MKRPTLRSLLTSHSTNQDVARREFILNVLLLGLSLLSFIGLVAAVINLLAGRFINGKGSVLAVGVFFLTVLIIWRLAKLGQQLVANYTLLSVVGILVLWLMYQWSYELAVSELCYGLLLVMSGILLSARSALRFSVITLVIYLLGCYAQVTGWLHPSVNWLNQPLHFGDVIGDAIVFCIIILISWLANREVDRSLFRARSSEAALAHERDSLEVKVFERTRQLEETQTTRLLELQRFAEFGRLSANLLHEVANPLTAASLNLEQLEAENHSQLSFQVRENVQRIERYVSAARKQLVGEGEIVKFNVSTEIDTVVRSLESTAKKFNVEIVVNCSHSYSMVGDAIKFSQLLRNLLRNGIEAYPKIKHNAPNRRVEVTVSKESDVTLLEVRDWGIGIKETSLIRVFDPFYSTKQSTNHNLGIGLSMVKQFVEEDFSGNIKLTSNTREGTCFQITLRQNHAK